MLANYPGQAGCLAQIPGFGRVFDCGKCGAIHVSVGAVMLSLSPDAFAQFVAMMQSSAASFETWMQSRPGGVEPAGQFGQDDGMDRSA